MPVDPVNKLGDCSNPAGFDPETCWNQTTKRFADPTDNGVFNLPYDSHAYVYTYNTNGTYTLCAITESGYGNINEDACPEAVAEQTPALTINCGALKGYVGKKFNGYVSAAYAGGDAITWQINSSSLSGLAIKNTTVTKQANITSGNNIINIPGPQIIDITARSNAGASATKSCAIVIGQCGDNFIQAGEGETCDDGANNTNTDCTAAYGSSCTYCTSNCQSRAVKGPDCGDDEKNGAEQCDGSDGVGPHQSCSSACILNNLTYCGDGEKNGAEVCDNGATSVTLTQSCTKFVTLPCGDVAVAGTKTCNSACDGWDACDASPPASEDHTSTACDFSDVTLTKTNYACCELTKCSQDGCACCGRGLATTPPGYTSRMTADVVWDPLTLLDPTRTSCLANYTACGQCPTAGNSPASACRLNQSTQNNRNWLVTTNHSTADYRCWR